MERLTERLRTGEVLMASDYHCSECGKVVNNRYELPKYCPNCGCRMDGGDDE